MLWIAILGGLLIMMGQHDRSEALFTTSAWKIRFQRPPFRSRSRFNCVIIEDTSAMSSPSVEDCSSVGQRLLRQKAVGHLGCGRLIRRSRPFGTACTPTRATPICCAG